MYGNIIQEAERILALDTPHSETVHRIEEWEWTNTDKSHLARLVVRGFWAKARLSLSSGEKRRNIELATGYEGWMKSR